MEQMWLFVILIIIGTLANYISEQSTFGRWNFLWERYPSVLTWWFHQNCDNKQKWGWGVLFKYGPLTIFVDSFHFFKGIWINLALVLPVEFMFGYWNIVNQFIIWTLYGITYELYSIAEKVIFDKK